MDIIMLEKLINKGHTTREIAILLNTSKSNVGYYINKLGLNNMLKYSKPIYKDENMFNKIDTKEKAYILGYILADGYVNSKIIELGCAIKDKEILEFISKYIGGNIIYDKKYNKQAKRFPRARMSIGNKNIVIDINKHGSSKESKRVPIINKKLDRYLLQGFFDGDGCITFGERKDRARLWHKISFSSSLKLLEGIQKILINRIKVSTIIKPKKGEKCFVLEFSNKYDVINFLDYIYPDNTFIVLKRKYKKTQALRLELGEFGERQTTPSEATE